MERRAIIVRGIVQGVGFRPFVFGLAQRCGLAGFVRNDGGAVQIEVEGDANALDCFTDQLKFDAPPHSLVGGITSASMPCRGGGEFRILDSEQVAKSEVFISPDIATCDDCVRELFDSNDRRYRYPFINCTRCGPRLTIIVGAPYDRERTTMASFAMCDACRAEYEDPANRRFHAQPIACSACGPKLHSKHRGPLYADEGALREAILALRIGKVVALKGLGGYHLACDATQSKAVEYLRGRKRHSGKPFAVMVPNLDVAHALCNVSEAEARLLQSPRAPIVLLTRKPGAAIADEVAPRSTTLGVMLPYTPLHHLLMRDIGELPLVMTSGNESDEPIAVGEEDAEGRLKEITNCYLHHDRPIRVRCDDSVTRIVAEAELPIRRSRGYAPMPIALSLPCRVPMLAMGGHMKATFALGRGRDAILSHHLGDLDDFLALCAYEQDIDLYQELFEFQPRLIVHDLHPDYASTHEAMRRAGLSRIPTFAVQHHHAHMASCMAEHGVTEPVIGVVFDGTGFGHDEAIWGGEFLVGDLHRVRRAAHLRYVPLAGGDSATRDPIRTALMYVLDAGEDPGILASRCEVPQFRVVSQMMRKPALSPPTSSMGRLFDAVASLLGVRDRVSYEGQAAIELEWLAAGSQAAGSYPFELIADQAPWQIDVRPMIREIVREKKNGVAPADIARRFHRSISDLIVSVCRLIRGETGLNSVALSGGVFMNALLLEEVAPHLEAERFRVLRHRLVPPNDGGLSLGQLAVAAASNQEDGL